MIKHVNIDPKTLTMVEDIKAKLQGRTVVKLSNTSKLGVKSWSLQALNTCPASIGNDGELVDACKGCYATSGNYRFSNVKAPREFNRQAWQEDSFVSDFINELYKERFFRWFDSGDMYDLRLAKKMLEIMKATPHVKHWLPTRMYKFPKFHAVIKEMTALDNVVVRLSSDSIDGSLVQSDVSPNNSTIVPEHDLGAYKGFICKAYEQEGKCLTCTACYEKDVQTVAYVGHGISMKKNQKLINTVNV